MMKPLACLSICTALWLSGPAIAKAPESLLPPVHSSAQDTAPATTSAVPRPALWKVADEDTTIYLFGTVHYLPPHMHWFGGQLPDAVAQAQEYVTEVDLSGTKQQKAALLMLREGSLPEGQSLRDQLSPEERMIVEQALASLDLKPDAMDRLEPWFAAVNLYLIAVMRDGYSADAGVERVLETQMAGKARGELESIETQTEMFDTLPHQTQRDYLVTVAREIGSVTAALDDLVVEWAEGDNETLGELIQQGFSDPVLAEAMLYRRNRSWAEWIDDRLNRPGTVFVAVGAGHLAGSGSVQDALQARGIETARIQ